MKWISLLTILIAVYSGIFAQNITDVKLKKCDMYDFLVDSTSIYLISKVCFYYPIILQRYDLEGNPVAFEYEYTDTSPCFSPQIAINREHIIAAWDDDRHVAAMNSYIGGNISQKNSALNPNNIMFNDEFGDTYRGLGDIEFIDDSTFIVVWSGYGNETGLTRHGLHGQIVTSSGGFIGRNILLASIDGYIYGVNVKRRKNSNEFVLSWIDNSSGRYEVYGRVFDKYGLPLGDKFQLTDNYLERDIYTCVIETTHSDEIIICWHESDNSYPPDSHEIFVMRASFYGVITQPPQHLTESLEEIPGWSNLSLSLNEKDESIIVWENYPDSLTQIFAQRFDSQGDKIGQPYKVSSRLSIPSDQIYPKVILTDNRIYCAWIEEENSENFLYLKISDFDNPVSVRPEEFHRTSEMHFELYNNYPNPFNSSTRIVYRLFISNSVAIHIYDITGKLIRILNQKKQMPGTYYIDWDGNTMDGKEAASGIYFYKLCVGNSTQTKKMILLR